MALDGHKDMATNRGFRMKDGAMYTYEQHKLGLSAYYDKRWVLEDGIHTEPHGQLNKKQPYYISSMGRGRSGFVINFKKQMRLDSVFAGRIGGHIIEKRINPSPQDVEAAKRLTKEQLAYILFHKDNGGNCVSGGTTINSSRPKPRLGPSNK